MANMGGYELARDHQLAVLQAREPNRSVRCMSRMMAPGDSQIGDPWPLAKMDPFVLAKMLPASWRAPTRGARISLAPYQQASSAKSA